MQNREVGIAWGTVWFGDLPDKWRYEPPEMSETVLDGLVYHPQEQRSVCLRLFLPNWNHSSGVLGARFLPEKGEQLRIRIGVSTGMNEEHAVNPGLPDELAKVVLTEVITAVSYAPYIGSGLLNFSHAAWHRIDSNKIIFRLLTRSVLKLLDPQFETASASDLNEAIKGELLTLTTAS